MVGRTEQIAIVIFCQDVGRVKVEKSTRTILALDEPFKVHVLDHYVLEPGADGIDKRERGPHGAWAAPEGRAAACIALLDKLIEVRCPLYRVFAVAASHALLEEVIVRTRVKDISQPVL